MERRLPRKIERYRKRISADKEAVENIKQNTLDKIKAFEDKRNESDCIRIKRLLNTRAKVLVEHGIFPELELPEDIGFYDRTVSGAKNHVPFLALELTYSQFEYPYYEDDEADLELARTYNGSAYLLFTPDGSLSFYYNLERGQDGQVSSSRVEHVSNRIYLMFATRVLNGLDHAAISDRSIS